MVVCNNATPKLLMLCYTEEKWKEEVLQMERKRGRLSVGGKKKKNMRERWAAGLFLTWTDVTIKHSPSTPSAVHRAHKRNSALFSLQACVAPGIMYAYGALSLRSRIVLRSGWDASRYGRGRQGSAIINITVYCYYRILLYYFAEQYDVMWCLFVDLFYLLLKKIVFSHVRQKLIIS